MKRLLLVALAGCAPDGATSPREIDGSTTIASASSSSSTTDPGTEGSESTGQKKTAPQMTGSGGGDTTGTGGMVTGSTGPTGGSTTSDSGEDELDTGPFCSDAYGPCEVDDDCCEGACIVSVGSVEVRWCSHGCTFPSECRPAPGGGTATAACFVTCQLNCTQGQSCPPGMTCNSAVCGW